MEHTDERDESAETKDSQKNAQRKDEIYGHLTFYRETNEMTVDFRSRLKQYAYSNPIDTPTQRRSTRLTEASPNASLEVSSSSPSKKRTRDTWSSLHSITASNENNSVIKQAEEHGHNALTPPSAKKRRSTTKERSARDPHSPDNKLVDSLRPGLTLVCIGLNPGLMTAATGHAYAHPSNRFWHLLYESGITSKKHHPSETRDLMDLYSIGNTNICARPTRSGDGLTREEMQQGALLLDSKIAELRPEAVVIVGKGIWEAVWMMKKGETKFKDPGFHWGWQDRDMQLGRVMGNNGQVVWPGSKTFVATSTSGLAATLRPEEKLAIWRPLGDWMIAKREQAHAARSL
ncbi:hypothetical protein PV10_03373 [Exophiala mesophila]|uniref:Uracil-DNA glycosylase-like domain-containing protein n=1 Tax=Exophiala mesophila TaxID=212818 RepID=A0A0D1ZM61_EXOME|nr:uncharacterized protein PV10_03373 [Exophiala mesophila]KIV95757.1 hypothetical protein PV10_03373 [Exophiala mesophila]